jgi:hypothetical protein
MTDSNTDTVTNNEGYSGLIRIRKTNDYKGYVNLRIQVQSLEIIRTCHILMMNQNRY